jgi:hypothetical protein
MAENTSKKGSPAWRRGVERARAQAVALLKRIGPNADQLSDEERRKMHRKLAADLQRLVRAIDKHLAEVPAAPPRATRTRGPSRRL